jgi:hypothetical protein
MAWWHANDQKRDIVGGDSDTMLNILLNILCSVEKEREKRERGRE